MKKLLLFLFLLAALQAEAQTTTGFDKSKLRFGATLGASISRNYTHMGLGPQAGYQFNPHFMAGAGLKFSYTKARTYAYETNSNLIGASTFGYLYPLKFIALFAQPEINYIWSGIISRTTHEKITEKGFVPAVIVGAGFRVARSHITLNYDVVRHPDSPHPNGLFLGISAFF
jgi:hypothetical protein